MSNDLPPPAPGHLPLDIHSLGKLLGNPRSSPGSLNALLLLAVLTVMRVAQEVILPIMLACVVTLVFAPVVRLLRRAHIPEPIGAAFVVLGLLAGFCLATANLIEPAGAWLDKAPDGIRQISARVRHFTAPVKNVTTATEHISDMTQDLAAGGEHPKVQEVTVKGPTLVGTVIGAVRKLALSAISTLVLLYFLLASGDMFLRKVIAVTPRLSDKKRAVEISRQIETEVSTYLFTVTLINAGLGCAVGIALYFMHVPNPLLWGVMIALFNFVPYLGDLASFTVLAIVGLLTFDEAWHALAVPGVFLFLTSAEGYVVTPHVLGRRLRLNPVVIVLSILFWGWMWGIAGALLAVPILVMLKTFCDSIESLQPFGEFLGAPEAPREKAAA